MDLDQSPADLATALARHGGEPLDHLADALIGQATQAEHRTDDIALLMIRCVSRRPSSTLLNRFRALGEGG